MPPLTPEQRAQNRVAIDALKQRIEEIRTLPIPLPELTYDSALTLHAQENAVRLMHFRAHTRGDTVGYIPDQRVLITGDLLDDLPFGGHGYPVQWVATLKALEALDVDWIVPGHGRIREGKTHLRLIRELFESIVTQVKDAIAEGATRDGIASKVDLSAFRAKLAQDARAGRAFDSWMPQAIERAYLELKGELQD